MGRRPMHKSTEFFQSTSLVSDVSGVSIRLRSGWGAYSSRGTPLHTENAREFFNRVLSIFESKLRRLEDRQTHPKTSTDYRLFMAASEEFVDSRGLGAADMGQHQKICSPLSAGSFLRSKASLA